MKFRNLVKNITFGSMQAIDRQVFSAEQYKEITIS